MDPVLAMQAALQAGGDDAAPAVGDAVPAVGDAVAAPALGVGGVAAPALGVGGVGGVAAPALGAGGVAAPALGAGGVAALGGAGGVAALGGAGGVAAQDDGPRILLRRSPDDLTVNLLARVTPQWALPRTAGPETPPNNTQISRNDSINRFLIRLSYPNLENVPGTAKWMWVSGGLTIEQICANMFSKLESTNRWDYGRNLSSIFFAINGKGEEIYIPKGTKAAEILNSIPNHLTNGVDLSCTIVDHAPLSLYAIVPAPLE